jgi:hypothetical protein
MISVPHTKTCGKQTIFYRVYKQTNFRLELKGDKPIFFIIIPCLTIVILPYVLRFDS